jgi:uracil-DNA glycosylase
MPVTDDEIREKYLERAIRELNTLTRELQACPHCPRGNLMPVLGSGHPQADIMLLKHSALPSEIEEGVAFYGRAGGALMKSLKRLSIDPLAVYGTLCVKCPLSDASLADFACISRVVEEIAIVQPKIVVVMGVDALNALGEMEMRCTSQASMTPWTSRMPSATSGLPFGCWGTGTRRNRRTEWSHPRGVGPAFARGPRRPMRAAR